MEAPGKVIAIILMILVLFLAPLAYFTQRQDTLMQNYVYSITKEFVNEIQQTGKITKEAYDDFILELDASGNVYDVQLIHSHKTITPKYQYTTVDNVITDDVTEYFSETYTDAILSSIYEEIDETYYLTKGDYITIKVTNKNKTLGTKLLQITSMHSIDTAQLMAVYGGEIQDEID